MGKKKGNAVKVAEYRATLTILGRKFQGVGETAQDSIAAIEPGNVRGKGVLIVEHGDAKQERILPPAIVFRAFGPAKGLTREISLKQIAQRFAV